MAGPWICLMVSSAFHRGDARAMDSELRRVFKGDMLEARMVKDDNMGASGEYYAFVRCSNYDAHIDDVEASRAVVGVVLSYDDPTYMSDKEVEGFLSSLNASKVRRDFVLGDVVKVMEGRMEGLYGIVSSARKDKCEVVFRLFTKRIVETLPSAMLSLVDNVFANLKLPVAESRLTEERLPVSGIYLEAREALIVSRRKIHRKTHRKCASKGS